MEKKKTPWKLVARISANVIMAPAALIFLSAALPIGIACVSAIVLFNIALNKIGSEMEDLRSQVDSLSRLQIKTEDSKAGQLESKKSTFVPFEQVQAELDASKAKEQSKTPEKSSLGALTDTAVQALTTAKNELTNPAPVSGPAKCFPVNADQNPDWTFEGETLCVLSGKEPPKGAFPVGCQVLFQREPSNTHDRRAVRFLNKSGVKGGYLYRGQLKELIFDSLSLGDRVVGTITAEEWNGDYICTILVYKLRQHTDLDERAVFCVAGHKKIGDRIR